MINNFNKGIKYALEGVKDFYTHPFLWKYTFIPLSILILFYAFIIYFTISSAHPYITEKLTYLTEDSWCSFLLGPLEFLLYITMWIIYVLLISFVSNCLFESIGAIFFPMMVREYERKILNIEPEKYTFQRGVKNFVDIFWFTIFVIFMFILLSIATFLFPFVGYILFIVILGYNYSIIFMSEAAFNTNCNLNDISGLFHNKKTMMYSFGSFTFFWIQLPFLSILFYPAFIIGGTKMFHKEVNDF